MDLRSELRPGEGREVVVVLVLALLAYIPALGSSFHLDDYSLLGDPAVTAANGWRQLLHLERTRPLTYLTFWLSYRLGGEQPWGYHAVNVALHLAAVAAAWVVFRRILDQRGAPAAAAVFALHPLQSEAVSYVFARATVLAALLCLLSWRAWLEDRRWRAAGWFVLAVLAKEECVAFPLFLLMVATPRGRRAWVALGAMVATAGAAAARLLYAAAHVAGAGAVRVAGVSPREYLWTQIEVLWRYLALLVVPVGQNFDHDVRLIRAPDAVFVAGLAGGLLLVALAVWRFREGGVWILGALVLMAPTSSFVPLADLMFEHRMYLPMMSLAAGGGLLLHRLPRPAVAVVAVALATATFARVRVWTSEETLWADAAKKSPTKVRPKLQLARAVAAKDPTRAEALLEEARRLDPNNPEVYTQRGALELSAGRPAQALAAFDAALRLGPRSADAHSNRGTALYALGRLNDAETEFFAALEIDRCHPNARHNLVVLYRARGETDRAQAIATPPESCPANPTP